MQIMLLLPCAALDFIYVLTIGFPMWIVTGIKIESHESALEWLFNLKQD
jgi:hypothetical protein